MKRARINEVVAEAREPLVNKDITHGVIEAPKGGDETDNIYRSFSLNRTRRCAKPQADPRLSQMAGFA